MFHGSLVALVTPYTKDLEVDYDKVKELVQWHIAEGTDGIVLCGCTGEAIALSNEEKINILKAAVDAACGKIPLILGTGCSNTRASVQNTRLALEHGADGCMAVVPYYNKPSEKGCFQHFYEISRVGLPVIVYHNPGRTGIKLSASILAETAALPNIVAIKDSSFDLNLVEDVLAKCETTILCGDDVLTYPMMQKGALGAISVVANIIPRTWKLLVQSYFNKDYTRSLQIQMMHQKINEALFLETNPQGIKYAMGAIKKCNADLRLPLMPISDETKQIIDKNLKALSLLK